MTDPTIRPKILVLSGAGLSADSGIPTFRDGDGLWEGHDVDVVANGLTWRRNRDLVRRFYNDRRRQLGAAAPNAAHTTIARWQEQFRTVVLTQNVDDLLERAGATRVVHLHGTLTHLRCVACGHQWHVGYAEHGPDDRCPVARCRSLRGVRPSVVFFHESAPEYATLYSELRSLRQQDLLVVIGTSGQVLDINSLVFDLPCTRILNNLGPCDQINAGYFEHVFYGQAQHMCKNMDRLVREHMSRHDPDWVTMEELKNDRS